MDAATSSSVRGRWPHASQHIEADILGEPHLWHIAFIRGIYFSAQRSS